MQHFSIDPVDSFDAPTGNFFLHNDHLGRPLAMSGTDGFLKWKGEFEPFGKSLAPRVKTSGIEPGFRFPGQWEYGDSGDVQGGASGVLGLVNAMEDNWHRSYTQRWGRYSQADPVGPASQVEDSYPRSAVSIYDYVGLEGSVLIYCIIA